MKQYEGTSMSPLQVIQEDKRKSKKIAARKEAKANKAEMPSNTTPKKAVSNQQTAKPRKQTIQAEVHANEDDEPVRVVKSKVRISPSPSIPKINTHVAQAENITADRSAMATSVGAQAAVSQVQDIQQQLKKLQLIMQELWQALETRTTSSVSQKNKSQNLTTPVRQGDVQQYDDKATPQKEPQSQAQSIAAIKDHKKQKNLPRMEIECEESTEETEGDEEDDNDSEEDISEDEHTEKEDVTIGDEDQFYGATIYM